MKEGKDLPATSRTPAESVHENVSLCSHDARTHLEEDIERHLGHVLQPTSTTAKMATDAWKYERAPLVIGPLRLVGRVPRGGIVWDSILTAGEYANMAGGLG